MQTLVGAEVFYVICKFKEGIKLRSLRVLTFAFYMGVLMTSNNLAAGGNTEWASTLQPSLWVQDSELNTVAKLHTGITTIDITGYQIRSTRDLTNLVTFVNRHMDLTVNVTDNVLFTAGTCSIMGATSDRDFNHKTVETLARWKAAGGRLDFFTFNQPIYFGSTAPADCKFRQTIIAARAAATAMRVRALYPRVNYIDAEPAAGITDAGSLSNLGAFVHGFDDQSNQSISGITFVLPASSLKQNLSNPVLYVRNVLKLRAGLTVGASFQSPLWKTLQLDYLIVR